MPASAHANTERPAGRFDVSRVLFWLVASGGLLAAAFAVGLHAGANRTVLFKAVYGLKATVSDALSVTMGEASTMTGTHPSHFLQPIRYQGNGVTVNRGGNGSDLILLSGFFGDGNELRLVRRSGDIVARWPVRYYDIFRTPTHFPPNTAPATNWNVDTHGALALPDGSVVFNFEWGGLAKLDRCGRVAWTLPRQTHHSVERAEGGGFWVPGRRTLQQGPSPFPPFEMPIKEDTILRVGDDGRIESETSVPKLLYDNGLEPLLTATGSWFKTGMVWDGEIVHLNKVAELPSALAAEFPMFAAGDLLLSLRDQNLLLVVDRGMTKIKWWKVGPWRRQHDPEFVHGGQIVIFNNNIYETAFGDTPLRTPVRGPRVSHIGRYDFGTGAYAVLYGEKPGQELLSVVRGKVDVTPSGGLLATEFEGGRVVETDANGAIVWEYVNRYDDDEVAEISEARVYPAAYFSVSDWSCGTAATN